MTAASRFFMFFNRLSQVAVCRLKSRCKQRYRTGFVRIYLFETLSAARSHNVEWRGTEATHSDRPVPTANMRNRAPRV